MVKLEEFISQAEASKEFLAKQDPVNAVPASISYWTWYDRAEKPEAKLSAQVRERDKLRLAYYSKRLRAACFLTTLMVHVRALKSCVIETRKAIESSNLKNTNCLIFESGLINCVLAEEYAGNCESRCFSLSCSSEWTMPLRKEVLEDGTSILKPYTETEVLHSNGRVSVNMHEWLESIYQDHRRIYFVHKQSSYRNEEPKIPEGELRTRLEAEKSKYLHDLNSDYSYTTATIYRVLDGKIIKIH